MECALNPGGCQAGKPIDWNQAVAAGPSVNWYLTFDCDLACLQCGPRSSRCRNDVPDLNTAQALDIVEQIADVGARTVLLSGGEPLLRRDAVQLMTALVEHGVATTLETHAIFIDSQAAAIMRSLHDAGLFEITVRLGAGYTHALDPDCPHFFEATLRGMECLRAHGVGFAIQTRVSTAARAGMVSLFELARRLGPNLRRLQLSLSDSVGSGFADLIDSITEQAEPLDLQVTINLPPGAVPPRTLATLADSTRVCLSFGCRFPVLGILPNGDVTICALSRGARGMTFGNVLSRSLDHIWTSGHVRELRGSYEAARGLEGVCGNCIWAPRCKGGCRVCAHEACGNLKAAFPTCSALHAKGLFPSAYLIGGRTGSFTRCEKREEGYLLC